MARKNSKVGRSNDRGRIARNKNEQVGSVRRLEYQSVPVEKMVTVDGQCFFNGPRRPKARFGTKEKAELALSQAKHHRARMLMANSEERVYECPRGGCGGWHLARRARGGEDDQ